MNRAVSVLLFIVFLFGNVVAAEVMSPFTRISIGKGGAHTRTAASSSPAMRQAIVRLNDGVEPCQLTDYCNVDAAIYGFCTITASDEQLMQLSRSGLVSRIHLARRLVPCNDVSRALIGIDDIHSGKSISRLYTGKGVVYGTLDMGVDFNHIAFSDAEGRSRILWAYLPEDTLGNPPHGNCFDDNYNLVADGVFPGSEYSTDQLGTITADCTTSSHGSHTIGTAAGSYMGNAYYGMAPDCSIVACASPVLSDVAVLNSILYVFSKAKALNMPAVINFSLVSTVGPHDGTSPIPALIDSVSGPGRIVVLSAGNDGNKAIHLSRKFQSSTDTLKSFVVNKNGSPVSLKNNSEGFIFDVWSKSDVSFGIRAVIYNVLNGKIVYESPRFDSSVLDESILDSTETPELAQYFNGKLVAAGECINGRQNIMVMANLTLASAGYRLGFIIDSDEGAEVDVWGDTSTLRFSGCGQPGWTDGDSDQSISDLATGSKSISVGSYNSRNSYQSLDGTEYSYSEYPVGEVSAFSSYGYAFDGSSRPDVVAPGCILLSSLSNYATPSANIMSISFANNGRNERWGAYWGTSMASPCVAGIIATWLEANPSLDPEMVKLILKATAVSDVNTEKRPLQSGAGKVDGYAGLLRVLESGGLSVPENSLRAYACYSDGILNVIAPNGAKSVEVVITAINGATVLHRRYASADCLSPITIDVANLAHGMYVVAITCGKGNSTSFIKLSL